MSFTPATHPCPSLRPTPAPRRLAGLPEGTRPSDLMSGTASPEGKGRHGKKGGMKGGGAPKTGVRMVLKTRHADGSELKLEMQVGLWRGFGVLAWPSRGCAGAQGLGRSRLGLWQGPDAVAMPGECGGASGFLRGPRALAWPRLFGGAQGLWSGPRALAGARGVGKAHGCQQAGGTFAMQMSGTDRALNGCDVMG